MRFCDKLRVFLSKWNYSSMYCKWCLLFSFLWKSCTLFVRDDSEQKMAAEGRKFDLKKIVSNDPRMCPQVLGGALSVAKHPGTILTSLNNVCNNFVKIEKKMIFFQFFQSHFWITGLWSDNNAMSATKYHDFSRDEYNDHDFTRIQL